MMMMMLLPVSATRVARAFLSGFSAGGGVSGVSMREGEHPIERQGKQNHPPHFFASRHF
jgi:hypothetical protein